ncbi:GMC oxidoreductase-domain-containing protein [Podospora aff. communis PSN243]|uniref:GMC oxidoreductase-domain-containing protein n=1 Tax=Podospora aff. communis PSN243 TaxID=3040156 RepID=A0AAV9GMU3_9PEZI|nr:GMC oxidoreductase-domain-containing protein [Podospora aff. communis PSN243]
MPLHNHLPSNLDEVDLIIAGGGSAGCIVAGRLAAADPNLHILLIEGGRNNYNDPNVIHAALGPLNLAPEKKMAIFYKTVREEQLAGREMVVPSGGILGGGSSINAALYTRAQRSDYDAWDTEGWSAEELWPYLKKLETYYGDGKPEHHGFEGPIHMSDGNFRSKALMEDLLEAAAAVGYPEIKDLQDLVSNNGFSRWLRTVSPEGRRQDSAHGFVHPLLADGKHPNLHVLVEHQVVRVLFDEQKRTVGVELVANPIHQDIPSTVEKRVVRARKMVVVSAGACGSPSILERSGVGSTEVLTRAGIPQVVDLPGVGHDYQDHHLIITAYKASLHKDETIDIFLNGSVTVEQALADGNKMLGWNGTDVAAKIRPKDEDIASMGPEFQTAWNRDFRDNPNKPLMFTGMFGGSFGVQGTYGPDQYISVADYTMYPYSRGHLHVTGPNIADPLDFRLNFFTDEGDIDIKQLTWGYKNSREIMRRSTFYRGELASTHPAFPPNSKARLVDLNAPLFEGDRSVIKNLEYSPDDDRAIEAFLRRAVQTTWHSLGTNKMAPREKMGVVDKDLNVYGIERLKVVDLSIAPGNVGGNTNNTAMMIGEKGADIIAKDLGIVLSSSGALT